MFLVERKKTSYFSLLSRSVFFRESEREFGDIEIYLLLRSFGVRKNKEKGQAEKDFFCIDFFLEKFLEKKKSKKSFEEKGFFRIYTKNNKTPEVSVSGDFPRKSGIPDKFVVFSTMPFELR